MKLLNCVKTCITYSICTIAIPLFMIPCCILALMPTSKRYDNVLYFKLTQMLARIMVWATFIRYTVTGREHLPTYPMLPAIIISNHISALDIPLIETLIGSYPHVWMSKAEYKKIPLLGFLLQRMHILVHRQDAIQGRKALVNMLNLVKNHPRHAILFPEGTRHQDGNIHAFHPGFAVLAQKLKQPVIPIVISGIHKIFPKKSLIIDSSCNMVRINIGKPIYFPEHMEPAEFVKQVQQYFQITLENIEK